MPAVVLHGNTSASVVGEMFVVGILASLDHVKPRCVGWTRSASGGVPVLKVAGDEVVTMKTSATEGVSSQIDDAENLFVSAVASADPSRSAFVHMRESDDGQSTVPSSADIFESRHDGSFRERLRLGADPSSDEWIRSAYYTTEASRGRAEA